MLTGDMLTYFADEYKTAAPKGSFRSGPGTVVRVFNSKTAVELQHIFVLEGATGAKGKGQGEGTGERGP